MRAEFSEDLVTGNELIDSQHKELIDRIMLAQELHIEEKGAEKLNLQAAEFE